MAAVAAEPGAAAVSKPDQDPGPVDPLNPLDLGPGSPALTAPPETPLEAPGRREAFPTELQQTRGEEGRHVGPEPEPAAGTEDPAGSRAGPGRAEPGLPDPQPPAVFPFSVPAPQTHTEPGLSLDEPDTPTTGTTDRAEQDRAEEDRERDYSPEPEPSVKNLSPGTEVRVSLDHVIDDALVVSFRFGEKVFSGVLMDVCKRFGPYGIPITMFPRRDNCSKPQLSVLSPPVANDDHSIKQEEVTPPPHPWTSKPPPLFQEGAPYPPPLFIRDTYNQALPQPLPRKIKRPKRRYRCEEPTSIMNSIKLRPRQVLCDKCKAVVSSSGPRETRRGAVDLRGEEASRRRRAAEGPISSELKRLKSDDKTGRPINDRRPSSTIRVTSSSSSSAGRMLRGVASATSNRMCLNSKKVLDKRSNVDRSKARQVLNKLTPSPSLASPHRRLKDQNQNQNHGQKHNQDRIRAVTRATALQNHNQKVHFTRRLQHHGSTPVSSNSPLPPRMRLKPQRYRTDEGQAPSSSSSPPKQITRALPPKSAVSSAPTPVSSAPPPPATTCPPLTCTAVVTQELRPPEEKEVAQVGGGGDQVKVEEPPPPPSSSSSVDSSQSECSSTETFDLPPPGCPPSSSSSSSSSGPPCPSPSPVAPPLRAGSEEIQAGGEEGDEDGGEFKRRRKSSTSSTSSSSSSSSSVFSKLVSKCSLPDGRTVCVGDIVWAKIYGFPWWPARILGITVARRGDTGLAVRQEARVSWFGSPTTSFLPLGQLSPFLESFQSRFDRKRKGPYRRAIAEAASAAKQLTPEVRALLTQFET